MGLDISTLFVANILVLAIASAAYTAVFVRNLQDRYWLYWVAANLVLVAALSIYVGWPQLAAPYATIPDALLLAGFALRLAAARSFAGRPIRLAPFLLAPGFMVFAVLANELSLAYAAVNMALTVLAGMVAWEFWRDRGDGLFSRSGLVLVYGLMALSFAARAGQGMLAGDQVQSYIPFDVLLEFHLVVALVHVIAGSLFVLSLASECSADALREAARRDPLTGLLNRRAFDDLLARHLGRDDVGLALVDVDYFKAVNDSHGHAVGDVVLKAVSDALETAVGPRGHVARVGGEEFALVLPQMTATACQSVVETARAAVEARKIVQDGKVISVTVSAGLAHADDLCRSADDFLECADAALYRAKANGRNACFVGRRASDSLPWQPFGASARAG